MGLPRGLRFLTPDMLPSMVAFPADVARLDVEPNRLETHALVRYYEAGWGRWYE